MITITNNNQCKPIKKEKIKLVKKLFVNNDNRNKVNDEKEEIIKYFFYKCLLILKQWLMGKNYLKHKKVRVYELNKQIIYLNKKLIVIIN